jgi:hypothetical protein
MVQGVGREPKGIEFLTLKEAASGWKESLVAPVSKGNPRISSMAPPDTASWVFSSPTPEQALEAEHAFETDLAQRQWKNVWEGQEIVFQRTGETDVRRSARKRPGRPPLLANPKFMRRQWRRRQPAR